MAVSPHVISLVRRFLVNMNRETIRLLAEKYMVLANHEQFADWAVSCLEAGLDTKSIRILASLQKPMFPTEVVDYFYRSLKELGWNFPEPKDCVIEYARFIAEEILCGKVSPVEGCRQIYKVVLFLEYPPELMSWLYLDEGLEPTAYRELTGAELDAAIIQEARKFADKAQIYVS